MVNFGWFLFSYKQYYSSFFLQFQKWYHVFDAKSVTNVIVTSSIAALFALLVIQERIVYSINWNTPVHLFMLK